MPADAVSALAERGIEARVLDVQVVVEDDPTLELARDLLKQVDATYWRALEESAAAYRRATARKVWQVVRRAGLSDAQTRLIADELMSAFDMRTARMASAARVSARGKLITYFHVHLIPHLKKENTK